MSAEVGIIVKMNKGARPPPPVPPRPSKSLIKEALAKTRLAHGNYVVSVSKSQAPIQPPKEFQNKRLIIDNNRPVVYQSDNCKSRSICSDVTNKSETNDSLKKFEDLLDVGKVSNDLVVEIKDELKQIESDKDEINKSVSETENHSWENEITIAETTKSENDEVSSSTSSNESVNNCCSDNNGTLNRNHVNTLIDEMFASVLEVNLSNNSSSTESITKTTDNKNTTVIVINEETKNLDKKVKFNDHQNHEFLINELQKMKSDEKILKRQRRSPLNRFEDEYDADRIQKNGWYALNEGKKVRMSSCNIKIEDEEDKYQKMKSLSSSYGLPPLPSSLSGFKFIMDTSDPIKIEEKPPEVDENSTDGQIMNLEKQLSILRREMDSLREQDLSLLSKLWFLNESIQDFRQMLQDQDPDQDDKINLSLCPSPTPSSIEDDDFYVITTSTC